MFSLRRDASKVAFVCAVRILVEAGYTLVDSQVYTSHLAAFGAEEIPRRDYISLLSRYRDSPVSPLPGTL
jgi:leucyl/phenylalanyl-tRNA--protein transferase